MAPEKGFETHFIIKTSSSHRLNNETTFFGVKMSSSVFSFIGNCSLFNYRFRTRRLTNFSRHYLYFNTISLYL